MNDLNDYNYYYFLGMAHGFGNSGDLLLPRFALRPANDARLARLVAAMGLYNALPTLPLKLYTQRKRTQPKASRSWNSTSTEYCDAREALAPLEGQAIEKRRVRLELAWTVRVLAKPAKWPEVWDSSFASALSSLAEWGSHVSL
jgi:hypothetical protein